MSLSGLGHRWYGHDRPVDGRCVEWQPLHVQFRGCLVAVLPELHARAERRPGAEPPRQSPSRSYSGDAYFGEVDNHAYSLAAECSSYAHALAFAYQKIDGDTSFDYVGGDCIFLAYAVSISDFKGPNETSYQLRYDINFAVDGVPGLEASARYVRGDNVDGTNADAAGA